MATALDGEDEVLRPDERAEYERLLHDPRTNSRTLQAWLAERGVYVCRGAIRRHRLHFVQSVKGVEDAARLVQHFAAIARHYGPGSLGEATAARYEQLFMQRPFQLDDKSPGLTWDDWASAQKTIAALLSTRRQVEQLRTEVETHLKDLKGGNDADGKPRKFDGAAVVNNVREILGIPLDDGKTVEQIEQELRGGRTEWEVGLGDESHPPR